MISLIAAVLTGLVAILLLVTSSLPRDETAISPTAHYTGYVWVKNGLSDPRLLTPKGKFLFHVLEPLMALSRLRNGPTAEEFLLARHQLIDYQLEQLVDNDKVTQIIELGAGLSPRGLRFRKKYGDKLIYIEADLPEMSRLKQNLIRSSLDPVHHSVMVTNVLLDKGPGSLQSVVSTLNKEAGTVIITEGLLNYFDEVTVKKIWRIISDNLSSFSYGAYVSDIHLDQHGDMIIIRLFQWLISAFVRGRVHLLFPDRLTAEWALIDAGFLLALVHRPQDWADEVSSCGSPGARMVHIITSFVNPK